MKISAFLTISNPIRRQDPFTECLNNLLDFADEVIIVNGGDKINGEKLNDRLCEKTYNKFKYVRIIDYKWPKDFDWKFIGEQFTRGYNNCTGDWVIRFDSDYFIHEYDFQSIREFLENCDAPIASMPKKQFLLTNYYRVKSLVPVAFNKKKYGDRIKLDSGGDLCQPSLDGKELKVDENPIISYKEIAVVSDNVSSEQLNKRLPNRQEKDNLIYSFDRGICLWNYDFTFKQKEIIETDWKRFRNAWKKQFGKDMGEFMNMMKGRWKKGGWRKININEHPKYIQEKIKNIRPEQFGYDGFGELK